MKKRNLRSVHGGGLTIRTKKEMEATTKLVVEVENVVHGMSDAPKQRPAGCNIEVQIWRDGEWRSWKWVCTKTELKAALKAISSLGHRGRSIERRGGTRRLPSPIIPKTKPVRTPVQIQIEKLQIEMKEAEILYKQLIKELSEEAIPSNKQLDIKIDNKSDNEKNELSEELNENIIIETSEKKPKTIKNKVKTKSNVI